MDAEQTLTDEAECAPFATVWDARDQKRCDGNEFEHARRASHDFHARTIGEGVARQDAEGNAKVHVVHEEEDTEACAEDDNEDEMATRMAHEAQIKANMKAHEETARRAQEEADEKTCDEKRLKTREDAARKAEEAARKAEDAARKAHEEANQRIREEVARQAEDAARKAQEEADQRIREEVARQAEDAAKKAQEEANQRIREEVARKTEDAARLIREEVAKQAEDAATKAHEEANQRIREEVARQAEDAARRAQEEADQRIREEVARKTEDAATKAHEEANQWIREEVARQAEDASRKAQEEADQRIREEVARQAEDAAKKAQEEADSRIRREVEVKVREEVARKAAEAERRFREEAELRVHAEEEAERSWREQIARTAREESERWRREEAAWKAREELARHAQEEAERRLVEMEAREEERRRREEDELNGRGEVAQKVHMEDSLTAHDLAARKAQKLTRMIHEDAEAAKHVADRLSHGEAARICDNTMAWEDASRPAGEDIKRRAQDVEDQCAREKVRQRTTGRLELDWTQGEETESEVEEAPVRLASEKPVRGARKRSKSNRRLSDERGRPSPPVQEDGKNEKHFNVTTQDVSLDDNSLAATLPREQVGRDVHDGASQSAMEDHSAWIQGERQSRLITPEDVVHEGVPIAAPAQKAGSTPRGNSKTPAGNGLFEALTRLQAAKRRMATARGGKEPVEQAEVNDRAQQGLDDGRLRMAEVMRQVVEKEKQPRTDTRPSKMAEVVRAAAAAMSTRRNS